MRRSRKTLADSRAAAQPERARVSEARPRPSVMIFVVVSLGLLVLYLYPYPSGSLPQRLTAGYLAGYARVAGALLRVFDPSIRVDGDVITGRFALRIVRTCDAAEVVALFLAAIVAYPAGFRERLVGGVVGVTAVLAFNLLRIASLYWIGVARPGAFEVLHVHVWPVVLIVFAAVSFLGWIWWTDRSGHAA